VITPLYISACVIEHDEVTRHTTTVPTKGTEKTSLIWNSNGASTTYLSSICEDGRTLRNVRNVGRLCPVTLDTMNIGHNLTVSPERLETYLAEPDPPRGCAR
jgi:hypothetical protein